MSRKNRIENLLDQELKPLYLSVEDESSNHHVPKGAETHFKIVAVSLQFNDLTRIARHRLLNHLLGNEFEMGLHALSMHLYTPAEWEKNQRVSDSPTCKGGFKNN